jgi:Recombinase
MRAVVHLVRFSRGFTLQVIEKLESVGGPSPFSSQGEISDFIEFRYIPLYRDRSFLHQKYMVEGLSIDQISKLIFSSKEAVRRGLLKVGIPLREPHKPHRNPSQPRYGQRKVRGRPVVKHAGEERVINAILDMRAQGLSLRQIASFLSKIGVPTKRKSNAWHPEMVARILDHSSPGSTR